MIDIWFYARIARKAIVKAAQWIGRVFKLPDDPWPLTQIPQDQNGHRTRLLEVSTALNETQLQYNNRLELRVELLETRLATCEQRHQARDEELHEMRAEIGNLKVMIGTNSEETLRGRLHSPTIPDNQNTPK